MNVALLCFRRHLGFAALGLGSLCSLACSSSGSPPGTGGTGPTGTGGANATGGTANATGGTANATGGTGSGGDGIKPVDLSKGGPKLRVLTKTEYKNSVSDLLGTISAALTLPEDTRTAGFASIGGGEVSLNVSSVDPYEVASRAIAGEVFGDNARWQKLVGCQPKADLSDACVGTFVKSFGRRAFRRDLTDEEVQQWLGVGTATAQLASSAAQGLGAIVSGLLQSPNFLYRVEINKLDTASGRLKYDGLSMATRMAYLLTGRPPSDALLTAAASGQLDTADGVKTAAAPLLNDPKAVDRMTEFFSELSGADIVSIVDKAADQFPNFNATLRSSMLEGTRLFIKNIVLAPSADVRTLFDSDQTFVDANLAPIYGVAAPTTGSFAQIKLGPETGRAGILGQAAVVAGNSPAGRTSPTHRGIFITSAFLCRQAPSPPAGVNTNIPADPTLTTRQRLENHRKNPTCAGCHALFDPAGIALEHFDPIGQYRAMEGTLAIDAGGTLDGVPFDGEAQFGAALRGNSAALKCMVSNFYRNANGVPDATADAVQLDTMVTTLTAKNYVWRDLVSDFVASDAFRSAPAAPATAGNP